MVTRLVSLGLRPAAIAVDVATASTLAALDAVLRSRATADALDRVLDSPLVDRAVARLLDHDALWTLVEGIAESPAVTAALRRQSAGLGDELAGELRVRSRHADAQVERGARRLLRRRAPATPIDGP